MRAGFIALFIGLFTIATAHAAIAIWAKIGPWEISGDSEERACLATATYDTGRTLGIVFIEETTALVINKIDGLSQGKSYLMKMSISTGEKGLLTGTAHGEDAIVFGNLSKQMVKALANSEFIEIDGIGLFELKGSKQAMASAWECYEALNSI